jgi:Protein of unknown function (DUF2950)
MMKLNRVPTAQGKHARGGARNCLANGDPTGGVALVAHPATDLNSGIKSFMCNRDGVVYEKNLGLGTALAVAKIKAYDPYPTWTQTK